MQTSRTAGYINEDKPKQFTGEQIMVREQKPLDYFRSILEDIEEGRYDGYYADVGEDVKTEAKLIYKHVVTILEEEEEFDE